MGRNSELYLILEFVAICAFLKLFLGFLYTLHELTELGYSPDSALRASFNPWIFVPLLLLFLPYSIREKVFAKIKIEVSKDTKASLYLLGYLISMFVMFLIMYDVINYYYFLMSIGYTKTYALKSSLLFLALTVAVLLLFSLYYLLKLLIEPEIKKLRISGGGVDG